MTLHKSCPLFVLSTILLLSPFCFAFGQLSGPVVLSVYVDSYYVSDNDHSEERRFATIGFIEDEIRLNTAQISAAFANDDMRATATIHHGSIRQNAWDEATATPLIQEANAGIRIVDALWLDAGFFLTHIGGEALLPKDNFLSSHTLITLMEPFYQAGLRFSYAFSEQFNAQLHILNGYGIFEDNNANKSLGILLMYSADQFDLSYANLLGNEGPDAAKAFQMYHNLVVSVTPLEQLTLKGQFDIAMRDDLVVTIDDGEVSRESGTMMGASLTAHVTLSSIFSATGRFEYFNDEDGFGTENLAGIGVTGGIEAKASESSFIRCEVRMLNLEREVDGLSDDARKIFVDKDNEASSTRLEFMLGIGVWI